MAFNKRIFEQFAMQVESTSKTAPLDSLGVNIDTLSGMLNIEKGEGRSLARYLGEIGWAVVRQSPLPCLTLTPKGHEEIAKLRRPRFVRWYESHDRLTTIILGAIAGLVTSMTAEFLKRILWP